MNRLFLFLLLIGGVMFTGGAGMRGYAQLTMRDTEQRLIAARPASPVQIETRRGYFIPADSAPTAIRLPNYQLWNTLEPVSARPAWQNGAISSAWDVRDAGWLTPSGWPGWSHNVVIAGHSPSRDSRTWARSVFRQLAYLKAGDRIEVTAGKWRYVYEVARVFAIPERDAESPEAAAWIDPGSVERLTLITCWPPHTAAYRVIVVAQPLKMTEYQP